MFDTDMYLRRIGYSGSLEPTWETLRELHKKHLMSVPYDTRKFLASTHPANIEEAFKNIVLDHGGGICIELNALFCRLLDSLGFKTLTLTANVWDESGRLAEFNLLHTLSGVLIEGESWLVDVGLSTPSFLYPLRLTTETQEQHGCQFKLVQHNSEYVLHRKSRNGDWKALYQFEFTHRELDGGVFSPQEPIQPGQSVPLLQTITLSRAIENGHLQLMGKRYLEVEDGYERMCALVNPKEYEEAVSRILN